MTRNLLTMVLILSVHFSYSQDFSLVKEQLIENDIDGATKTVQKLLKEVPESGEAHYWLGACLYKTYGDDRLNSSKDKKPIIDAGVSFEKARFLDESCVQKADGANYLKSYSGVIYNIGVTSYQEGDMQMAFTFFRMSVEASDWLRRKDSESLFYAGHCANKLNDSEAAKDYLSLLVSNEPDHIGGVRELLKAHVALSELNEGKAVLKNALIHHPEEKILWRELMVLGIKMDAPEEALSAAQTLSHLDSENPENLAYLASLYDRTGDTQKAISSYVECLTINPDHPKALHNIGVLYYNDAVSILNISPSEEQKEQANVNLKKAMEFLQKAKRMDPANEDIALLIENIEKIR